MFTCDAFTKFLVGSNETVYIVINFSNPKDLSMSLHFPSERLCHSFNVRLCIVLHVLGMEDIENIMKLLLTNHLEQKLCK